MATAGGYLLAAPGGPATARAASYCAPAANPSMSTDSSFDGYTASMSSTAGVGAADQGVQSKLSDGREVYPWSDSFVYSSPGSLSGFIHNSITVQDTAAQGGRTQSDVRGSLSSPQSLIPDGSGYWWWAGASYTENGRLLVFTAAYNGSNWTGGAGIAGLTEPAYPGLPSYVSGGTWTSLWNDPSRQWGFGFTYDSTYNYIYGSRSAVDTSTDSHDLYLARVPRGQTTQTSKWQFDDNGSWVSSESSATVVNTMEAEAVSPLPSAEGSGYLAVSTGGFPGAQLEIQYACSPGGPWSSPQPVGSLPETNCPASAWSGCPYVNPAAGGFMIAYQPTVQGYQPASSSGVVVTYSVNYGGDSNAFNVISQHPVLYQNKAAILQW
jgi:hypothetical protein